MAGMNAHTGHALNGIEHIQQSVADIITTPIGTRVMRRDYGSLVPELIDRPMNDALLMQVYAATVVAVSQWEPRLRITRTQRSVSTTQPGAARLTIEGQTRKGDNVVFEVPL